MPPSTEARETILVVDDAPDTLEVLRRNLMLEGYRILAASGVAAAIEILRTATVDLVITDLKMPEASGMDLVRAVKRDFQGTEVMMITGYATVDGAVQAVKAGAEEFLPKPFTEEELFGAVKRALAKRKGPQTDYHKAIAEGYGPLGIIGVSEAMREVFNSLAVAARTTSPVMITGEQGTGKELAARTIHYQSARAAKPFIVVRCGFIPAERFGAESFGLINNRASSGLPERKGQIHFAAGGTLFLKEVNALAKPAQVLLENLLGEEGIFSGLFLHEGEVPRVMCSTSQEPGRLPEGENLSQGLSAKLSPHKVRIPPLRERGEDVEPLVYFFLNQAVRKRGRPLPAISDSALAALKKYPWPGNAREVQAIAEQLAKTAGGGAIGVSDLPVPVRAFASQELRVNRSLVTVEADYIRGVLDSVQNNKTRAARILGINRKTLREKLRKSY